MNNILLVEDNVTQSLELEYVLERNGYTVETVYHGEAALKKLASNSSYKLVISDVVMPGLSGYELCERIKAGRDISHIPVMLITSTLERSELMQCIRCGADAFLTKPYKPGVLITRVRTLLDNGFSPQTTQPVREFEIKLFGANVRVQSTISQLMNLLVTTLEDVIRTSRDFELQQIELESAKGKLEVDALRIRSELGDTQEKLNLRNRAIESLDQALVIVEWEGTEYIIADANTSIETITGYQRADLIGKPMPILTGNLEAHDNFLAGFKKAHKSHSFSTILQITHLNGSVRWCRTTITPISAQQGSALSFACVLTDITTDQQVELALTQLTRIVSTGNNFYREAIIRMNEILGTMTGYIVRTDNGGHATTLMNIHNGEVTPNWSFWIKGTPLENIAAGTNAFLSRDVQQEYPNVLFFQRYGIKSYAVQTIRGPQGSVEGLIGVMSTVDFPKPDSVQEVLRVYSIAIGAEMVRQKTSHSYRQLFESAPNAVILSDVDGEIRLVNAQAHRLFNYPVGEMEGKSMDTLLPADLTAQHRRCHDVQQANPEAPRRGNTGYFQARRSDGSMFPANITFTPIESESGLQVLSSIRDVTLELQQEEDRAARTVAEQANIAKSSFLATMSHEIRTPINGIIGSIELLSRHRLTSAQLELVRTVMDSSHTLLHVIDDILDFSKIEAGKLEVEAEPVSLQAIVESSCHGLVSMARKKGVKISLFTDPLLPDNVLSDSIRLRQILSNLLSNAIKFSANPEQTGHVRVRAVLKDDEHFQLSVTDNGIGMSQEYQDKLFTPFTQEEASTTRRFGGTGLGLSICKHLTDLLGGEIHVQSTPGEGTSFTVDFPIVTTSQQGVPAPYSNVEGLKCIVVCSDTQIAGDWGNYLQFSRAETVCCDSLEEIPDKVAEFGGGHLLLTDHPEGVVDAWLTGFPEKSRPKAVCFSDKIAWTGPFQKSNGILAGNFGLVLRNNVLTAVAIAAGREDMANHLERNMLEDQEERILDRQTAIAENRLILVAEDNEVNQEVLQKQLEALGYIADIAADGQEALAIWQGGHYAMLLTDVHMPRMDGYELTAAVRSLPGELSARPIIALTANALPSERANCINAGMNDYLSKPVSLDQLNAKLEEWSPSRVLPHNPIPEPNSDPNSGTNAPSNHLGDGYFDPDELARFVGPKPESLKKHIHKFQMILSDDMGHIEEAFRSGDIQRVAELAHRIKSSARMMGAVRLADCCEQLESLGKSPASSLNEAYLQTFQNISRIVDSRISDYLG